mmetsp:Transcript_34955/g.110415  ORF Transcript_34955/g.110415 Transcript_34955/m.110415 type:complete len:251 (+) Transcript_34955:555-1307(+)
MQVLQLLPERRYLLLPLLQHLVHLRAPVPHVHLGLVLDELGAVPEAEGGEGLRVVPRRGGARHDQRRAGRATERILQDSGELGVSVGDVAALAVRERLDHVAEGGEGLVDLLRLLQPLVRGARLGHHLRTRQVDEEELPCLDGEVRHVLLRDRDHEDRVRAAALLVHARGRDVPHQGAALEQLEDLHVGAHLHLGGALDVDALVHVHAHLEVVLLLLLVQKVPDPLHVDLYVLHPEGHVHVLARGRDDVE